MVIVPFLNASADQSHVPTIVLVDGSVDLSQAARVTTVRIATRVRMWGPPCARGGGVAPDWRNEDAMRGYSKVPNRARIVKLNLGAIFFGVWELVGRSDERGAQKRRPRATAHTSGLCYTRPLPSQAHSSSLSGNPQVNLIGIFVRQFLPSF
jgi:hypothetical protein